jgi:uncharacterized protein
MMLFWLVLLGFCALNAFAFVHGRAMTHFVAAGHKTPAPEELTLLGRLRVLAFGIRIPKPVNLQKPKDFGLAFQTVFIGAEKSRLEAWYIERTDPRGTILLFPGYATAKDTLLPNALVLHQLGYNCVLADFRGCGGSDGWATSIGFLEAEDVRGVVEHFKDGVKPLVVYAPSMAAAAALRAISLGVIAPDALILECPFDNLVATVKHRFEAMRMPSFPLAQLLVLWGGWQMGFNALKHNPVDYAAWVQCPVLFMHGGKDPRVTMDEARRVFDAIPAQKEFFLFPELGHESYAKACPREWREAVDRFLRAASKIKEEVGVRRSGFRPEAGEHGG